MYGCEKNYFPQKWSISRNQATIALSKFYPMPSGFDKVLPSFRGYYGVCSWEIQDFSTILFFMYFTNFYLLRYGFLVFNLLKRCTKGENLQTRIL